MIVNYLARRSWGRVLLIPVILAVDGWKCLHWMLHLTSNEQDLARTKNVMGWRDPRLDEPWLRLSNPSRPDYGSWMHSASNVASERARIDFQRTAKSAGFWFSASVVMTMLAVAGWLL
jgi:hypothetical protein